MLDLKVGNSQGTHKTDTVTERCSTWSAVYQKGSTNVYLLKIFWKCDLLKIFWKCDQNPWKTKLNEFIFSLFLTVRLNTYSKMYSCTDVFSCLGTVGEQLFFIKPFSGWFCFVILVRGIAVTSFNLSVVSHNLSGNSLYNMSQETTCIKPMWLKCCVITLVT